MIICGYILLFLFFYLLYINGYMVINAKRAIMFVGSIRGKDSCKARFSSCSGYMKRVIRFDESRSYNFVLVPELTEGELVVEILDSNKQNIMKLDAYNRYANIVVDKKKRYYLVFNFQSASGSYELDWN